MKYGTVPETVPVFFTVKVAVTGWFVAGEPGDNASGVTSVSWKVPMGDVANVRSAELAVPPLFADCT
jgi:hypothetical protein